jgi:hypothetical protein
MALSSMTLGCVMHQRTMRCASAEGRTPGISLGNRRLSPGADE